MRIALLLPSIYSSLTLFPDKIFAPRELCADLANGLVDREHDITVYSVPDFPTKAALVSEPVEDVLHPQPYHKFRGIGETSRLQLIREFAKHRFELRLISRAFEDARNGKFDVVHVYHDSSLFLAHYIQQFLPQLPVCYTLHDPLPPEHTYEYSEFQAFARHTYISISNSFRHSQIHLNFVDTVYHGIDPSIYPFNPNPSDRMLFLGRLVPEKGLHSALVAAGNAGQKLVVSVNVPKAGETNAYYDTVQPMLSAQGVTVYPVVDKARRIELYGQAKALLFPIEWEEPFGVVLIEAMACGTPVIAFNRGSVAEIVEDGVSGFIIDPDDAERPGKGSWIIKAQGNKGLIEAIGRIGELDRSACRKRVHDCFSVSQMIEGYERAYGNVFTSFYK